MIPVATTSVLIYGGTQIIHGRMTVGDMVMFTTYLMMLLGPLEVLASSASDMQTNLAAFDRVLDVLAEPAEFHDTRGEVENRPHRRRDRHVRRARRPRRAGLGHAGDGRALHRPRVRPPPLPRRGTRY